MEGLSTPPAAFPAPGPGAFSSAIWRHCQYNQVLNLPTLTASPSRSCLCSLQLFSPFYETPLFAVCLALVVSSGEQPALGARKDRMRPGLTHGQVKGSLITTGKCCVRFLLIHQGFPGVYSVTQPDTVLRPRVPRWQKVFFLPELSVVQVTHSQLTISTRQPVSSHLMPTVYTGHREMICLYISLYMIIILETSSQYVVLVVLNSLCRPG